MRPVEAFRKLGYKLISPRSDWSAKNQHGVCLALWRSELKTPDGNLTLDTRIDCEPIEEWGGKPGNKRRIEHLKRACAEFGGNVDVVLRYVAPHNNDGTAEPWDSQSRGMGWKVEWFDPETGHFKVSASRQII